MKTILLGIGVLLFLALGSCTETIYEEVIKLDTVFLSRPVTSFVTLPATRDTVFIRDTVRIETIIRDTILNNIHTTDTIYQVVTKDSLIIKVVEKTVTIRDTVTVTVVNNVHTTDTLILRDTVEVVRVEQRVIYLATEYIFPYNSVTFIPTDLQKYYEEYIAEAYKRGKTLIGGDVVFSYVDPKDLPGEGWVSNTFEMAGNQQIIQLSSELIQEHSRAAVYREMTRWQLRKKYSNDPTKIMSNFFRTAPEPTQNEINTLFQ
jgi:hypothetical protein